MISFNVVTHYDHCDWIMKMSQLNYKNFIIGLEIALQI